MFRSRRYRLRTKEIRERRVPVLVLYQHGACLHSLPPRRDIAVLRVACIVRHRTESAGQPNILSVDALGLPSQNHLSSFRGVDVVHSGTVKALNANAGRIEFH